MRRFIVNAKYSLSNWKNKKMQNLFLLVQVVASLILLCFLITNYFQCKDVINKINYYMREGNIYSPHDLGDFWEIDEWGIMSSGKDVINAVDKIDRKKILVSNELAFNDVEGNMLNTLQVNEDFFDLYDIKIDEEIESTNQIFTVKYGDVFKQQVIPVYLGSDYKKLYNLDDVIECSSVKFKVAGFLKKRQTLVLPMQQKESISTNDIILIPFYLNVSDVSNVMSYVKGLQLVANDKSELKDFIVELNDSKIGDYYLKNYSSQLEVVKNDYMELFVLYGSMGIILTIFSIISIIGMIIQIMEDKEFEYGVSMMCGATKSDIFVRLVLNETLIFVVGMIIIYGIYGMTLASNLMLVFSLVCVGIMCILSFKAINPNRIVGKIKSKE